MSDAEQLKRLLRAALPPESFDDERGRPRRVLHPLEQLLADHLAQAGFDMLATPIAATPTPASVRKVWEAFCRFGACDASQVATGLRVADHGDSLWFEPSAAREAAPNLPAHPPQLLLSRRLRLVTADDEFEEEATAFLTFDLSDRYAEAVRSQPAIYGHGVGGTSPPADQAAWVASMERSLMGECLTSPGAVIRVH